MMSGYTKREAAKQAAKMGWCGGGAVRGGGCAEPACAGYPSECWKCDSREIAYASDGWKYFCLCLSCGNQWDERRNPDSPAQEVEPLLVWAAMA
jgi:hypothetical protein